jgi:C-terminal processing protease CtpA/Prc
MSSDPVLNFEAMWKMFDDNYGCFEQKRIDWNLLHRTYRPMIREDMTDDELFSVLTGLLEHLNDNHVKLKTTDPPRFYRSGVLGNINRDEDGHHIPIGYNIPDFSLDLVKRKYLKGTFNEWLPGTELAAYFGGRFGLYTSAWIEPDIAYLHIRNFDEEERTAEAMDEIMAGFTDARGLVLDVRGNGGGWDPVAKAIADRFADSKRLFMTIQVRSGPGHRDFDDPELWYVEPKGPLQFTRPVVMLTHRWTISAGDCFVLAMRVMPHVINLGEFTSGAYSDEYWDVLPNGWDVCVCNKLYLDPDGMCWEGIGTPPDIRMLNCREDIKRGHDRVLERAVAILKAEP